MDDSVEKGIFSSSIVLPPTLCRRGQVPNDAHAQHLDAEHCATKTPQAAMTGLATLFGPSLLSTSASTQIIQFAGGAPSVNSRPLIKSADETGRPQPTSLYLSTIHRGNWFSCGPSRDTMPSRSLRSPTCPMETSLRWRRRAPLNYRLQVLGMGLKLSG